MDDRPNFLIIMTDQQRADCLSIEGHPALLTPNLDNVAAEGVRFSHAYATCPVCMPARRSFMAGQFPVNHGLVNNAPNQSWWNFPPTLPGALREAGYHTCLVGRDMHQYPRRRRYGFDHMVTHEDYSRMVERAAPEGSGSYHATGVMHNDWTARPWHLDEAFHHSNWTVTEALRFLRDRDPSCPFFLVVSFLAPHPPLIPPSFYFDRYLRIDLPDPVIGDWALAPDNRGLGDSVDSVRVDLKGEALRSCRAAYYGLINHIDDQIRRILHPLGGLDRETAENTVVLFTSDHGEMLGDHYLFRKSLPYEQSSRVPLLIRTPLHFDFRAGAVIDKPVCLEDIMPTLLDLADVKIPTTVDGKSLLPLMREEEAPWRPHLHIECSGTVLGGFHCLTDGKEKYIWWAREGREQFFNLTDDPDERRDLGRDGFHGKRVAKWRNRLIEHLRERPEGFSDGGRLVAGRNYERVLPHARSFSQERNQQR